MIANKNIIDLIPPSGEISKPELHDKIREVHGEGLTPNALLKRLRRLEKKGDVRIRKTRQGNTNVLMLHRDKKVEQSNGTMEQSMEQSDKKVEQSNGTMEQSMEQSDDNPPICVMGRRIEVPAGSYEDALQHIEAPDVLRGKRFREILSTNYKHMYSLTCILGRSLRDAFPAEPGTRIFDLTKSLIKVGVRLVVSGLRKRGVLKQQCSNCFFPFHPSHYKPQKGRESICNTDGEQYRIPSDDYEQALHEVADAPILKERACRSSLENFYANIYLFTCILARKLLPTDEQSLDLAGILLIVGTETISRDLLRRHILESQCAGCPYPLHSSPPTAPRESQAAPSVPAPGDAPPMNIAAQIAACADQIARFIDQIEPIDTKSKQGILRDDIIQQLSALGFSKSTINEALVKMTSDGTVYVPLPERFSLL